MQAIEYVQQMYPIVLYPEYNFCFVFAFYPEIVRPLQLFLYNFGVILCSWISKKVLDNVFKWYQSIFWVLTMSRWNVHIWWAAISVDHQIRRFDCFTWDERKCQYKVLKTVSYSWQWFNKLLLQTQFYVMRCEYYFLSVNKWLMYRDHQV